jgi:hypothetical protein
LIVCGSARSEKIRSAVCATMLSVPLKPACPFRIAPRPAARAQPLIPPGIVMGMRGDRKRCSARLCDCRRSGSRLIGPAGQPSLAATTITKLLALAG